MALLASEDPRSSTELFSASLEGDYDDEAPWQAVAALRLRGTVEVFELAAEYCRATDAKARARGLDVLAQLGEGKPHSERPYLDKCVSIAISSLEDGEPMVVHSAAWALAHLRTDEATSRLLRLRDHPQAGVRQAVATGLGGAVHKSPECVAVLIELMDDPDEDVRDWATFGLGSLSGEDSPKIREALQRRLDDPFEPARSEAVWGLAHRRDRTGLRMLLERLESGTRLAGDEDAAEEILGLESNRPIEDICRGMKKLLG